MPEFFTILIKVNIALVLFCLGYYLVLRKLTFYTLNRAYLITGILCSSVYPFIDLSVFAQQHQDIVAPVQNVVITWEAPARNFVKQAAYWNWLEIAFWTGAAMFAARLLFQMVSLYRIHARSTTEQINGQNIRIVDGDISPFSFWKSIYVNPEKLNSSDLKNVLAHEQVHVDEWHTLDILLTEISVIFYWFNPGIWMMKRAVRENIEFITDRKILQKGLDSKAYQYSLLNITFNQPAPAITSNFNFSTLKKRITMMNAKRSSKINLTRYVVLIPLVAVCLLAFSLSKAEVVKTSPIYKTITNTVHNINRIVLATDTTPKQNKATTTFTTIIDTDGKTGKTISITTDGRVSGSFNYSTDTGRIRYYKNLGVAGGTSWSSDTGKKSYQMLSGDVQVLPNGLYVVKADSVYNHTFTTVKGFPVNQQGVVVLDSIRARSLPRFNYSVSVSKNDTGRLTIKPTYATSYIFENGKSQPLTFTAGSVFGSNTTDFSNKLIVIDGNEATEKALKKISIGDISNIRELKGRAAIDKYGEKGKNGVVVITTKKSINRLIKDHDKSNSVK